MVVDTLHYYHHLYSMSVLCIAMRMVVWKGESGEMERVITPSLLPLQDIGKTLSAKLQCGKM